MPSNRQLSLPRSLAVSHGQLTMLRFVAHPDSYLYEPWFVFVQKMFCICNVNHILCNISHIELIFPDFWSKPLQLPQNNHCNEDRSNINWLSSGFDLLLESIQYPILVPHICVIIQFIYLFTTCMCVVVVCIGITIQHLISTDLYPCGILDPDLLWFVFVFMPRTHFKICVCLDLYLYTCGSRICCNLYLYLCDGRISRFV